MKNIKNILNQKNIFNKRNITIIFLITVMCGVIVYYQAKKQGFHEDEVFSFCSAVNSKNGLISAYDNRHLSKMQPPTWKSGEYIQKSMTLSGWNYANFISVYINQAMDNHPPIFYALVHISACIFGGKFSKYPIFIVNIIAFIVSCFVIDKIFKVLNKTKMGIPAIILYGFSMGTISMVLYQRMYMLLTLFVLLYFYYTIKIYKSNFALDKHTITNLGFITVCGFLTQYFFAIYAAGMFIAMVLKMLLSKSTTNLKKYITIHLKYAFIGVIIFTPCFYHSLFTNRGVSNLANGNFIYKILEYIKCLIYSFSANRYMLIALVVIVLISLVTILIKKQKDDIFYMILVCIPSILFLLITAKITSFQELRYIMPVIPFIVIAICLALHSIVNIKCKEVIFTALFIIITVNGFLYSKPKYLYENYNDYIKIAKENSEKSFVYIYDNSFNHMQSVPEMMIYNKTLVVNKEKNELEYLIKDESLQNEDLFILSIKSYMNNEEIINEIKNRTDFKNVTPLYIYGGMADGDYVENNIYLVSKTVNGDVLF